MIIDLSKPREQYFQDADATDIMRRFVHKEEGNITVADLRQLNTEGKVVVATTESDLEQLIVGEEYTPDSGLAVQKIKELGPGQLLVLPQYYRIDYEGVRQAVVYSIDTLVKLDSVEVKRELLGPIVPAGKLSAHRKQQEQWHPEKVIGAAFNYLHEHPEEYLEKTLCCYSWYAKDAHREIVSLMRAINGAELRAFQNYAAFKLMPKVLRKELRTGKKARDQKELTPEQLERRRKKLERYEKHIHAKKINQEIEQLQVDFSDLIEPIAIPFAHYSGRLLRVPSRSRPQEPYKHMKLTNLPMLPREDSTAYSVVWDVRGNCVCEDKTYRSDRRRESASRGRDEEFFCAHEIAALYSLRKIYESNPEKNIPFLPFVIPTREMMDYLEKLRHQTIMITFDSATERASKRALNHTEMENLVWKKVVVDGYEANFTTDINKFKSQRVNPDDYLIRFQR
ncbi:hypothetical protein HZC30_07470 [Candidatus Woesearchaeota archaeon]|nr:hypothetical protein [Candidatus Woesearchaeota archaeon]